MLNVYKYFDDAKSLPHYNALNNKLELLNHVSIWDEYGYTKEDVEPLKSLILKSPRLCYYYAAYILKNKWPEGEPVILEDPKWAFMYARNILKRRWEEAEPIIEYSEWWVNYTKEFGIE